MTGYLYPLKAQFSRKRFAVIDIETKDGETQKGGFTRPFLTGYYDGNEFVSYYGPRCIESMLAFMLDDRRDGWSYYAHAGGSFDWLHFLPMIAAYGYSFEIMTVQSKIQMLKIKPYPGSKKQGWKLLDSYQLIPNKLEKIAKALKTEVKKQENFDYDTPEDDPRWKEYLQDDCVALYQSLVKFYDIVEKEFGGEVGITLAASSMKTYRRRFQNFPFQRHEEYHDFFRQAYYGGRVEILTEQASHLRYYDINSSYPYAMLASMPVGKLVKWEGEPKPWVHANGARIGFARATVHVPYSTYLPILPYRADNGKLIFPVGNFTGVWPVIELNAAIAEGAKVTWHDSVWIDGAVVFSNMVNEFYKYRDKDSDKYDETLAYVSKILLNSLYGKFATKSLREKIIYINDYDTPPEGSFPADPTNPDCSIYTIEEEIDAQYIMPQISAHITAIARLHLHRYAKLAMKNGLLCYMDTDAVITTADLSEHCSSKLGGLKDEGKGELFTGTFIQPKLYYLENESGGEDKVVMKGYPVKNKLNFQKLQLGETLSFDTLEKIGAMVKKGFKDGPKIKQITKCIRTNEQKRRHFSDGTTLPLIIEEN